ncbi:hypothetical protein [Aquabacterium humicola]|uniref:hypothetical protein n=1 Tax=Aquabacterium humicola TaxID=3237377 RepID=UPI002542FC9C|nr:hypothetical protein [Rubrivivax pictus]
MKPRDPYLAWTRATGWRRLRPGGRWPAELTFVVERAKKSTWDDMRQYLAGKKINGTIAAAYDLPLATGHAARFATLRLATRPTDLPVDVDKRVRKIAGCKHVARLQLGYPRGAAVAQASAPPGQQEGDPENAEVVLGVIDDGCPFGHPALLDGKGNPRIAAVWQQTTRDPASHPWKLPADFPYGRVLDRDSMEALIWQSCRFGEVDERLLYELAYTVQDHADGQPCVAASWPKPSRAMLTRASHGAGVIGLAAAPVRAAYSLQDEETRCHRPHGEDATQAAHEPAANCPILCVDLPREQVEISSGRWMPVQALDGIRFIIGEARRRFRRADGSKVPVVVNLSSGASAGAHAGQAMLERAMDELLEADDRLAITLAAGNSRETDAHAQLEVPAAGVAEVGLFVPASHPFDTCVEFWLPQGTDLRDVKITVTEPGLGTLTVHGKHSESLLKDRGGAVMAALFLYPSVVQATDRTMAMLAIAGTTVTSSRTGIPRSGPWTVRVKNRSKGELVVRAWVERDEVVFGKRRDQVARFFSLEPARPVAGHERPHAPPLQLSDTLSNIATGRLTFPVAAFRGRAVAHEVNGHQVPAGPVCGYSGQPRDPAGTAGRQYLPFAAVADAGRSHPGIRVMGNRGDTLRRMNGTSASAPQAARFLANEMARGLTRTEIVEGLSPEPAPVTSHAPPPGPPQAGKVGHPNAPAPAPAPAATPDAADGRLRLSGGLRPKKQVASARKNSAVRDPTAAVAT